MTGISAKDEPVSQGTAFQLFAAFIATLLAVTDGMTIGWTAPMIPYFTSEESHIKMTLAEAEWMETWLLIGVICVLPITVHAVDRIGRKKTLLISCALLIICWIVITVANRIEYIYAARFFKGSGLNMAFVAAPMYVGEIAHKTFRGLIASTVFVMMMIGALIVYSLIPFAPYYVSSVIAIVILSTQLVVFSFLPESPHYLVKKKNLEAAKKSLQSFRGNTNIDEEFEEILRAIEHDENENTAALKALFQVKNYRKSIIIVFFLAVAQPFACHEIIAMNLHVILDNAGSIYVESKYAAIIVISLMTVSAVAASIMMDKFGRRVLLIISGLLTTLCLLTLAIYFNLKHLGYNLDAISWIPIASVMVYALVFKVGLGMVPIVMATEIFASKIRALAMTISDGIYVIASIVSLQIFFNLKNAFGMHVPFYVFTFYMLVTLVFIIFSVPETKGKSMEEIQMILKGEKLPPVEVKGQKSENEQHL